MAKKSQHKVQLFIRRWEQNHAFFPDEEIKLKINTIYGKPIETLGSVNGHHIYCLDDTNIITDKVKDMRFVVHVNSFERMVILRQIP